MKFEYSNFKNNIQIRICFDPPKFDFQIPAGLNSAKSLLRLH